MHFVTNKKQIHSHHCTTHFCLPIVSYFMKTLIFTSEEERYAVHALQSQDYQKEVSIKLDSSMLSPSLHYSSL